MRTTSPNYDQHAEARLLSRREDDPDTGCWLFAGARTSNGYEHITYRGRAEYAHRVAAVLYLNYALGSPLIVMHSCDMPACFNPEHLSTGTQAENMRDAASRGRMGGGKLNPAQVAEIKTDLSHGRTYQQLSTRYGVSTTAIGQIARGVTWKDVEPLATSGTDS